MRIYSVDGDAIIPQRTPLLVFTENPNGLECAVAVYNPKQYVRWHTPEGKAVLNVVYWLPVKTMLNFLTV